MVPPSSTSKPHRLKGTRPCPLSVMPGISYPALPVTSDAVILALLYQFEQSEWWSAEKIFQYQLRQARLLIHHAWWNSPFYKTPLAEVIQLSGQQLAEELWRQIPILTRRQIQESGEQMISGSLPKDHGKKQWIRTSGSTGEPLQALISDLHLSVFKAMNLRHYFWQGLDLTAKVAAIRRTEPGSAMPPDGARESGYWAAAHTTGDAVALSVTATMAEQVAWLEVEAPSYLLSYATNIRALAEYCEKHKVQLPSLRVFNSFGEVLDPQVREHCQRAFGVPVNDSYSANEVGMIAMQCPQHSHYHVMSEGMLVEVLDEQDNPCPPGEIGRVVVTSLHNFAMPLIRYAIGDYAEVGEPCSCKRGLPVLKRILGKTRDRVALPSGEFRWFNLSSADISRIEPLRQWQIVQRSREEMEVTLALSRSLTDDELDRLTQVLHQAFGYPFALNFHVVDSIPRSASGKYPDFRCELEEVDR